MDTPYLKSYYRRGSTFLSSEQIETIRTLKGKVPKYRIIRDFHINENRVKDIWGSHERQQQIIQSAISSEILPAILLKNSNQTEREILLQSNDSLNLYLESATLPNTEIKKRNSKSVRTSDQSSISKGSIDKVDKLLETIPPEISQKTEALLELFKRTQKDAKKSRAVARADISKLSILNSKV
ncbi:hypothetical protein Glove_326g1 [Diversispora epigaea]|uniref:Uncharacterized protein n=1 Tax=Diversispora epigaea TaxID=1348612 RepID=A0A397HUI4_9GLOM|nr:hypothetical protein Glove_326g1 [Diversispora epigaea]